MFITARIKKVLDFRWYVYTPETISYTHLTTEKLRQEGLLDSDSSALNYIFCHPWHSRIWTVQETTYSQDCQVVCGNSTIPWDIYSAAAHFLVFEELIGELDAQ